MIANNNVCHGKSVVEQKYLILKKRTNVIFNFYRDSPRRTIETFFVRIT